MPSRRLLVAGLLAAIVGNAVIVWFLIEQHVYAFAGNLAAIVVCAGAIWLLRNAERFRGRG